jgi:MFS family permease
MAEAATKGRRKLTGTTIASLGSTAFGMNFFWAFYTGSLPLFLNDFTDSKFEISLVLSLGGLCGCVFAPIVGYLSDRTTTRFGRRMPYLLFGTIGLSLCLLVMPHAATFWMVFLIATVMVLSITVADTPYYSLIPDLAPPEQRGTVSGGVQLLGGIGLIAYFVVGSETWDAHRTATIYMVAAVALFSALVTIGLVREPAAIERAPSGGGGVLSHLRGLAEEANAMKFLFSHFLIWMAIAIIASFITLFLVEELGVSEGRSLWVLTANSVVSTACVLPLGMLGDRLDRKRLLCWMLLFSIVVHLALVLAQNFAQVLILLGFGGLLGATLYGPAYAFYLDLIPEERTAEFVGLLSVSIYAGQMVGPPIGGMLIDTLGYRSMFVAAAIFLAAGLLVLLLVRPPERTGAIPREASGKAGTLLSN